MLIPQVHWLCWFSKYSASVD